ncbi:unnamed protein product [Protopolystoma xenopodis]|uniref:Uncharacterized protein n=1 Tax=Protopolystoma xenopodis TaxID=117903 RepID=A0A3S5ASK9_9PLAT|nr:unnamed protein product [Protopolystoma xenopodis]
MDRHRNALNRGGEEVNNVTRLCLSAMPRHFCGSASKSTSASRHGSSASTGGTIEPTTARRQIHQSAQLKETTRSRRGTVASVDQLQK